MCVSVVSEGHVHRCQSGEAGAMMYTGLGMLVMGREDGQVSDRHGGSGPCV